MINQENIEEIFDVIDEACTILFNEAKLDYLTSLKISCNLILDLEYKLDYDLSEEKLNYLFELYSKLRNKDYATEEIRKALQYLILRAYKETKYSNSVTPDSIAYIFVYIMEKLFYGNKISILDPVIGSGNLLMTIANNYSNQDSILYGIDNDYSILELAQLSANMQNLNITLFNQTAFETSLSNLDLIIGDLPNDVDFSYEFINFHLNNLKKDGFMILLITNEFFEKNHELKEIIKEKSTMLGIIELPKEFCVKTKKSIIFLSNKKEDIKEFFIAQFPDYKDYEALQKFLEKLNQWFLRRKIKC